MGEFSLFFEISVFFSTLEFGESFFVLDVIFSVVETGIPFFVLGVLFDFFLFETGTGIKVSEEYWSRSLSEVVSHPSSISSMELFKLFEFFPPF